MALREYIGGPENSLVLVAATVLSQPAANQTLGQSATNPIFLYGPTGTAKTELCYTLAAMWQRSHPKRSVKVIDGAKFRRSYSTAMGRNSLHHWWRRFSDHSLLCLDDVEQVAGRRATEEILARLIDLFVSEDRPVVITGSVHPANCPEMSPRLASRLSAGLAVQLRPPGLEARRQIFEQLAQVHQVNCSSAVAHYAAKHLDGTVPELNDIWTQLISARRGSLSKISETDVRQILAGQGKAVPKASPESIIRSVARCFQVSVAQLAGPSRRHSLVRFRGIAIYLIRDLTGISLQQIGKYFAGRDHTTILHAYRKAESLVQCDPDVQATIAELIATLKSKN